MEAQPSELTLKPTINCQKGSCPHQNRSPDEWASLNLFWCSRCTKIWCDTCWNNVDAHGAIEERRTGWLRRMEDHDKWKVPLQDDPLKKLLVKHQNERRSLHLTQQLHVHSLRAELLNNHQLEESSRGLGEPSLAERQEQDYQGQLMRLEQENKRRLMRARQEMEESRE